MEWTFDAGHGPTRISLPHAWTEEPPAWDGPAHYRTTTTVPIESPILRFHGVSYQAAIRVDGEHQCTHEGIWDAFEVDLSRWAGRKVKIEVEVTKNGGRRFPVRDVLSGFLPFVFHTFGGIYREVEWVSEPLSPKPIGKASVRIGEAGLEWDGRPCFLRGVLHWGWYPEIGHPNPDLETVRREVRGIKSLGFNLVKFCLWVPPHRYCEVLAEEGMLGWMELPLWDPTDRPERLQAMADEVLRIVDQYRHHPALQIWTLGCELSTATSAEFRERLFQEVRLRVGDRLLKDNSGGAEMYGGDLREFGDFQDFHPYCDLPFYPLVLDGLNACRPILLGEFNDLDVHRDLPRLKREDPYWGSSAPTRNPMGCRWQTDLPCFLRKTPLAYDEARSRRLQESSRSLALHVRKSVHEMVRLRPKFAGAVITGLRDTPVSTSGLFDDWGQPRFSVEEIADWNRDEVIVRAPFASPTWRNGGNRPGFRSLHCLLEGQALDLRLVLSGAVEDEVEVEFMGETWRGLIRSDEWTQIQLPSHGLGAALLTVRGALSENRWTIHRFRPVDRPSEVPLTILDGMGTLERPFWREAAYEFDSMFWKGSGLQYAWEVWQDIAPDRVIDPAYLESRWPEAESEVLLSRVDTRTYEELPVLVRLHFSDGKVHFVTTVRPTGGIGTQPYHPTAIPSGHGFLGWLAKAAHQ